MLFVQSGAINIIFLCQVCNSRQVRNSHQVAQCYFLLFERTIVIIEGSSSSRVTLVVKVLRFLTVNSIKATKHK